jgi:exopolysaccharide biosynthesis polyprenyl glycosylphosphotransferase
MRRRRVVIVGGGPEAELVRRKLHAHPEYGLDVVASLDGDEDLRQALDELEPDRVLLAAPTAEQDELFELLRDVRRSEVHVSIVPRYSDIFTSRAILDEIEGVPIVSLPAMRLGRASRVLKRGFDVVVSSVLLVVVAPLLALVALAIRLDSRGPVFFRQTRVGRDNRHFRIFKFRTMVDDAEHLKANLRELNEVDGGLFKIADDPRITRVGRLLRRTSLDELPQLFNVCLGDMSLVGPRPLVRDEDKHIFGHDRRRLDLTPGMTGQWQIAGSARVPLHEMVKIDYLYVAGWSLWEDLKILLRTVPYVFARRGM